MWHRLVEPKSLPLLIESNVGMAAKVGYRVWIQHTNGVRTLERTRSRKLSGIGWLCNRCSLRTRNRRSCVLCGVDKRRGIGRSASGTSDGWNLMKDASASVIGNAFDIPCSMEQEVRIRERREEEQSSNRNTNPAQYAEDLSGR